MADENQCKPITQKLIVQGMLRMMERNIQVQSLGPQRNLIQSLFGSCQAQFSDIMRKETGKDSQVALAISEYGLE